MPKNVKLQKMVTYSYSFPLKIIVENKRWHNPHWKVIYSTQMPIIAALNHLRQMGSPVRRLTLVGGAGEEKEKKKTKKNKLVKPIGDQRIMWWKETPPVIGVKENVRPVCHGVLRGRHSARLTRLSVICRLNDSCCHLQQVTPQPHPAPALSLGFAASLLFPRLQTPLRLLNECGLLIRLAVTPKCQRGIMRHFNTSQRWQKSCTSEL